MKKKIYTGFLIVSFLLPQITFAASGTASKLRGKILLQVESHGEAWYVEPGSSQRAFLGRPDDAFQVMRDFGLGVSEASYNSFQGRATENLAGKILLRVEANGEAYYVNPTDLKMHYLGRPVDAFEIMRKQGLGISNTDLEKIPVNKKYQGLEVVKAKVKEYIETNLMAGGQTIEVEEAEREGDMYRVKVKMSNGQEIISYVNNDLTKFFPQVMDMNAKKEETPSTPNVPTASVAEKAERPTIELFVMSHCPYGIQIEKGILPVLTLLGDKIDFELKYTDYAMHGKKEIDEQMNQYCVQAEGRDRIESYLSCFLEAGDHEKCLPEVNISSSTLQTCLNNLEEDYSILELYEDKSTWKSGRFPLFPVYEDDAEKYGVTGSPSLVVNGSKISSSRDSHSLLQTICSAFTQKPTECDEELSGTPPSPGFGFNTVGSPSNSGCGS